MLKVKFCSAGKVAAGPKLPPAQLHRGDTGVHGGGAPHPGAAEVRRVLQDGGAVAVPRPQHLLRHRGRPAGVRERGRQQGRGAGQGGQPRHPDPPAALLHHPGQEPVPLRRHQGRPHRCGGQLWGGGEGRGPGHLQHGPQAAESDGLERRGPRQGRGGPRRARHRHHRVREGGARQPRRAGQLQAEGDQDGGGVGVQQHALRPRLHHRLHQRPAEGDAQHRPEARAEEQELRQGRGAAPDHLQEV